MAWADEQRDAAAQRAWIRETLRDPASRVFVGWIDGRVVGMCGLHARIAPGVLEIGYWTHVDFTRSGIATEMARRLCAIAFEDPAIDHVEIHHHPGNVASGRVPARLGFTRAGVDANGHHVWRLRR
jgi:RimJ/RimL family protein N-acetyltransferase